MKTSENITLVTVCDNHFVVMLTVLIKSIELNHHSRETIDLYIVEDKITAKNKLKLINSIDQKKINIIWLKITEVLPKAVSLPLDNSTFPLNVYVRLFIPYFLPPACLKAIYLDVDMVVKKDIAELWNTNLNGKYIAGVVDRSEKVSSTWGGITNYLALDLHPDTKYFNSGLLIMDVEKWRKTTLSMDILNCITDNRKQANFPDQYGLNVIFANQWFELDKRWNTYTTTKENDPYIIHFIGNKPIYSSFKDIYDYRADFNYFLKLTSWKDYKPRKNYIRLLNKLFHKANKRFKTITKAA